MEIGKTLYVTDRKKWRLWLSKNYDKKKEIWLIFYKKNSGRKRIPYNDAVEEALCYGWIDSIVKRIDDEKFAQRFTPRKNGSALSVMNNERVRRLIKEGRMTAIGLEAISHVFDKDKKEKFQIFSDIIEALKKDKQAWENFKKFPEDYKRIRIGYIESQRRHSDEMFRKSLKNFVKMTSRNKKFGMVR